MDTKHLIIERMWLGLSSHHYVGTSGGLGDDQSPVINHQGDIFISNTIDLFSSPYCNIQCN